MINLYFQSGSTTKILIFYIRNVYTNASITPMGVWTSHNGHWTSPYRARISAAPTAALRQKGSVSFTGNDLYITPGLNGAGPVKPPIHGSAPRSTLPTPTVLLRLRQLLQTLGTCDLFLLLPSWCVVCYLILLPWRQIIWRCKCCIVDLWRLLCFPRSQRV